MDWNKATQVIAYHVPASSGSSGGGGYYSAPQDVVIVLDSGGKVWRSINSDKFKEIYPSLLPE